MGATCTSTGCHCSCTRTDCCENPEDIAVYDHIDELGPALGTRDGDPFARPMHQYVSVRQESLWDDPVDEQFRLLDSVGHYWGYSQGGYFKPGVEDTYFEIVGSQIKATTGRWSGYYMGMYGDDGCISACCSGNDIDNIDGWMTAVQWGPQPLTIQSNHIGVQDNYAYASARRGRSDIKQYCVEMHGESFSADPPFRDAAGSARVFLSHTASTTALALSVKSVIQSVFPEAQIWSMEDIPVGAGAGGVPAFNEMILERIEWCTSVVGIADKSCEHSHAKWGSPAEWQMGYEAGKKVLVMYIDGEREAACRNPTLKELVKTLQLFPLPSNPTSAANLKIVTAVLKAEIIPKIRCLPSRDAFP